MSAATIRAAIQGGLRDNPVATRVAKAQKVIDKWGPVLRSYCPVPLGWAAVRIGHEAGTDACATSSQNEMGLLQNFPATSRNCGITPPTGTPSANRALCRQKGAANVPAYNPVKNITCGCKLWAARAKPYAGDWALANLTMSIGPGATKLLTERAGASFDAVWQFLNDRPEEFAALPRSWWGTQSHELVARRIAATAQWREAAAQIDGSGGVLEIAVGIVAVAGLLWFLKR